MLASLLQSSIAALSADAAAQFAAGYLYGITTMDKRDYIVGAFGNPGCFKFDKDLNSTMDQAIADMKKGDNDAAMKEWDKTKKPFEAAMADCKDVNSTFESLEKYKEEVLARKDIKDYLNDHYLKHKAEIDDALKKEIGAWELGVYFDSGMFAGYVMKYYGLAPSDMKGSEETRDPMAPA